MSTIDNYKSFAVDDTTLMCTALDKMCRQNLRNGKEMSLNQITKCVTKQILTKTDIAQLPDLSDRTP